MAEHWTDYQRRRWMKPNADLWMRPDAQRWLMPNQRIWMGPRAWEAKYSPDQPRDDHGRWTNGGGTQLAGTVIPICIAIGISLSTVGGYKSFSVTYECRGGRTFTISGPGHRYDGLVRDPFGR